MGTKEFSDAYALETRRVGYRRNKYEVEARETGELGRTIHLVRRVALPGPNTFTSAQAGLLLEVA